MDKKFPKPAYMNSPRSADERGYRDESFEFVSRFMAETKIQYRPHAKAPGSKSHVRYEKYSNATTIGEALKKGSWPMDWVYDYEHGFLKVLGRVREEPIDATQVSDLSM